MAPLDGRVILVTGSAKRIGRGIALRISQAGARVAIHYNGSADAARATAALHDLDHLALDVVLRIDEEPLAHLGAGELERQFLMACVAVDGADVVGRGPPDAGPWTPLRAGHRR